MHQTEMKIVAMKKGIFSEIFSERNNPKIAITIDDIIKTIGQMTLS